MVISNRDIRAYLAGMRYAAQIAGETGKGRIAKLAILREAMTLKMLNERRTLAAPPVFDHFTPAAFG